jgi:hypothetical protein
MKTLTNGLMEANTLTGVTMSKRVLILDEFKIDHVLYDGPIMELKQKYKSEEVFYKKLRGLIDNKQVYISNK